MGVVNWAIREEPWEDFHFRCLLKLWFTLLTLESSKPEQCWGVWEVALGAQNRGIESLDCFEVWFSQGSSVACPPSPPPPAPQTRLLSQEQTFQSPGHKKHNNQNHSNSNIFLLYHSFTCFPKYVHIFHLQQPREINRIRQSKKKLQTRKRGLLEVKDLFVWG